MLDQGDHQAGDLWLCPFVNHCPEPQGLLLPYTGPPRAGHPSAPALATILQVPQPWDALPVKLLVRALQPAQGGLVAAVEAVVEVDNAVIVFHVLVQRELQVPVQRAACVTEIPVSPGRSHPRSHPGPPTDSARQGPSCLPFAR